MARTWTVGEVAGMAHVTVRTLHHYDEIGLLEPSGRSRAGYRLYDRSDLERLHEILLFRELDLSLEEIGRVLDDPEADRVRTLRDRRDRLAARIRRTEAVLRAVDAALDSLERGMRMDTERMFDGLEGFDHARWAEEAEERWGDTDAYRESALRTRGYGDGDWKEMKAESDAIWGRMADLLAAGEPPTDDPAMDAAEEARLHIERWFYPCSHGMHVGLADMYEADPRFSASFEERAEGLTAYVAAAIRANAGRAEGAEGDAPA